MHGRRGRSRWGTRWRTPAIEEEGEGGEGEGGPGRVVAGDGRRGSGRRSQNVARARRDWPARGWRTRGRRVAQQRGTTAGVVDGAREGSLTARVCAHGLLLIFVDLRKMGKKRNRWPLLYPPTFSTGSSHEPVLKVL